jgi:CHAT domain-containing protein
MPRELMRYPWELLRDRHGWLVERFAIGRQLIADADAAPKWESSRRNGPLPLLVVAPSIEGEAAEVAGVGVLEGAHVAASFERLQERLPGMVDPRNHRKYVGQPVTVEQFRSLIRDRRYDVVHFAGHGRYDAANPERSCWMFSDGPLYAFELRTTLANAEVTPWLVYGSACEGARDGAGAGRYHDGVYGMASAALGQGVAAYVGPLWKISESDAKNLAAAFYEALLLRRTSVGEAMALARRSVRDGEPDLDVLVTALQQGAEDPARIPKSAGWTGMVLYGDPTPTVMQRLSPSDTSSAVPKKTTSRAARRRTEEENDEGKELT